MLSLARERKGRVLNEEQYISPFDTAKASVEAPHASDLRESYSTLSRLPNATNSTSSFADPPAPHPSIDPNNPRASTFQSGTRVFIQPDSSTPSPPTAAGYHYPQGPLPYRSPVASSSLAATRTDDHDLTQANLAVAQPDRRRSDSTRSAQWSDASYAPRGRADVTYSTDGADPWSQASRMSRDPAGAAYYPGRSVEFVQRGYDPSSATAGTDEYYTESTLGEDYYGGYGATTSAPIAISAASHPSRTYSFPPANAARVEYHPRHPDTYQSLASSYRPSTYSCPPPTLSTPSRVAGPSQQRAMSSSPDESYPPTQRTPPYPSESYNASDWAPRQMHEYPPPAHVASSSASPSSRHSHSPPSDHGFDPSYQQPQQYTRGTPDSPSSASSGTKKPKRNRARADSGGASGRPISPITGLPTKVLAKRLFPPRDSAKRMFHCLHEGCGKSFGKPSARETHLRSHNGIRPFECPIPTCGRPFSVFSNLKRHMIIHPGVDFRGVTVHDLPHLVWDPDRANPLFFSDATPAVAASSSSPRETRRRPHDSYAEGSEDSTNGEDDEYER